MKTTLLALDTLRLTKRLHLLTCATLLTALACGATTASAGQGVREIHTVFVTPASSSTSPNGVLNKRLIEGINKSGSLRVVSDEKNADAVLKASTVLWPVGTYAPNPRSKSVVVTDYQGYASADLSDKAGQPLWSYLATPSRLHFAGIVSDLADQLDASLLLAAHRGFALTAVGTGAKGAASGVALRIAGATFPAPLYRRWLESYAERSGGAAYGYDPEGSGTGLSLLAEGKIDIAASDIPAVADQAITEQDVLRFPTVVGAVVPIFNLAGVHGLNLTAEVLADIYSGKITQWNDARIRRWNQGAALPDAAIEVVHRSDASGTTFVWTSFLASASAEWKAKAGPTTEWPVGDGEAGSEGVAGKVAARANTIGYVELTYAIQHKLSYASVRNPAGHFIQADLRSISDAAESAKAGGSLLNEPGSSTYPIATFTYLVVRRTNADAKVQANIVDLLRWVLTSGQKQCSSLGYAPLPRSVVESELATLNGLKR